MARSSKTKDWQRESKDNLLVGNRLNHPQNGSKLFEDNTNYRTGWLQEFLTIPDQHNPPWQGTLHRCGQRWAHWKAEQPSHNVAAESAKSHIRLEGQIGPQKWVLYTADMVSEAVVRSRRQEIEFHYIHIFLEFATQRCYQWKLKEMQVAAEQGYFSIRQLTL